MKIETIKKSQRETTLEIENLGKRLGSIINRIQEMEDRISSAEDTIENTDTTVKENAKCKKLLTQNIQEIQSTIGIEEMKIPDLKGQEMSSTKL